MMFAVPSEPYEVEPEVAEALDLLLILHADHEQNCSTSTVRMVGSAHANLFASICAGISRAVGAAARRRQRGGDRDAGADRRGRRRRRRSTSTGPRTRLELQADGLRPSRLQELRPASDDHQGAPPTGCWPPPAPTTSCFEVAKKLEEVALHDEYFVERKLYPNVDFYSGLIYRAIGFPKNMFTNCFAIGRLPGWIAQWQEMINDPETKIGRPRQVYAGPTARDYVPIDAR